MSKIIDFCKKCKLPIIWTIGYVFALWATFHILFDFELFSAASWIRISRAHLHGLGGLTFSLITLAAIPLYIATTAIVIRTQKPLLALPVPTIISKILAKLFPKQTTIEPEKPQENESVAPQIPTNQEQDRFPAEMRSAFIYARTHPNHIAAPICSACSVNPNVYPCGTPEPDTPIKPVNNDLPLPPDFDMDDDDFSTPTEPIQSSPVFKDINFYDEPVDDITETPDTPETDNIPATDNEYIKPITEHIAKSGRKFTVENNDIIVTDNAIIAVHNDPDFWIMDEPTWFAAGKTRESPIDALLNAAKQHKTKPILYLGATNIMNMDAKITEWTGKGITIITDLSTL